MGLGKFKFAMSCFITIPTTRYFLSFLSLLPLDLTTRVADFGLRCA